MPTCFELCTSLSRSSNGLDIDGAQLVRGTWKIYMNTVEDTATLLATSFSFRGRTTNYNELPSVHNTRYPLIVGKVTIQDLPLNVDNKEAVIK